jgi:hypothetical protein
MAYNLIPLPISIVFIIVFLWNCLVTGSAENAQEGKGVFFSVLA